MALLRRFNKTIGRQHRRDLVSDTLVGEIEVSGNFVFDGYFQNPEATEKAFDKMWFRTGDIGFIHDNELFVCGRIKELLIVHGRNYYANDVEEVVGLVDGVKPGRVAVMGIYDQTTASEEVFVVAETTLVEPNTRRELKRNVRKAVFDRLELQIRKVEIVDVGQLVKTTSGKVSREENVRRFGQKRPETV
jgi:acyl-CoA synthetase (AMP-forming)/AMP-acid ligase II